MAGGCEGRSKLGCEFDPVCEHIETIIIHRASLVFQQMMLQLQNTMMQLNILYSRSLD